MRTTDQTWLTLKLMAHIVGFSMMGFKIWKDFDASSKECLHSTRPADVSFHVFTNTVLCIYIG